MLKIKTSGIKGSCRVASSQQFMLSKAYRSIMSRGSGDRQHRQLCGLQLLNSFSVVVLGAR
ncbi:MAG: hypothetical protein EA378_03180 [Phycisphaerales bacterium]|nr:MAG: hypothetical protein EA378_03180 [Phycisphaerales bacterium]